MRLGIIKRLLLLTASVFGLTCTAFGQALEKPNRVEFADVFVGPSVGIDGVFGGVELNYQAGRQLFSFRYVYGDDKKKEGELISPVYEVQRSVHELSILYGGRNIQNVRSYSISIGPCYNFYRHRVQEGDQDVIDNEEYGGVAYELNIKWFKEKRDKFRILGLFPVGQPTSFGGSLGLKLAGNFSRHSYIGLGFTYGLGKHKEY